jgi:ubiquinone/menaquinone biosynthesis C-methylase UbiE
MGTCSGQYEQTRANLTQQFIEPLLQAVEIKEGMRVADIACGSGYVSHQAKQIISICYL